MRWYDIPTEHRADRRCASDGCMGQPVARFEAWGIGSDYCADCAKQVEKVVERASAPDEAIDEGADDVYAGDPE